MSADTPLAPFATDEQLDDSVMHTLPDLYPVAPTIDLKPSHVYRDENITGEGFTLEYQLKVPGIKVPVGKIHKVI